MAVLMTNKQVKDLVDKVRQEERERHAEAIDILRGMFNVAFDPDDEYQYELSKLGETELQKAIKKALSAAGYEISGRKQ